MKLPRRKVGNDKNNGEMGGYLRYKKGGVEGVPLIAGVFLGEIGRFPGEIREKGRFLMSGAAARTGKVSK